MNLRVLKLGKLSEFFSFLLADTSATSAQRQEEPAEDDEEDDGEDEGDGEDDHPGLRPDVVQPVCRVEPV